MSARIISIGDELLCGRTIDTNASRTQRRLLAHGITVGGVAVAPDTPQAIATALDATPAQSLVVITGGLGPTPDDLTVAAVADWADVALGNDARTECDLRTLAANRGFPYGPNMAKQAQVPTGFQALKNPAGTAPGLVGQAKERLLVLLPGVPAEVDALWPLVEAELVNRGILGTERSCVLRRTCGLPEPEVDRRTAPIRDQWPLLAWSWWLTRWGVDVQVTALTDDPLPPALAEALDSALGDHVYAEDMTDLNAVVVNALSAKGWTMAVAESCTGGLIGAAITDVEGASAVFNGGALTYANSAKTNVLNVSEGLLAEHGAVSSPVAEAMATGARSLLGCDVALSVTGIAGPDGGSDDKPVGTTCIGLASPHGVWSKRLRFRSFRGRNRELAVSHALDAMRRYLASSTTPWSETAD